MNALGALLGLGFGVSILLVMAGLRGRPEDRAPRRRRLRHNTTSFTRLLVDAVAGFVAVLVTGWPVAGVLGAVAVEFLPRWLCRTNMEDEVAVIDDLITWIETMRDVLRAGGMGLQTAIRETSPDAPILLRRFVQQLAADCQDQPLNDALDAFARRVAHPGADFVVRALQIHGADRLADTLTSLATWLRMEADLYRRVDAQREPERLTVRGIILVTLLCLLLVSVLSRSFFAPLATAGGQITLAACIGLMGFGVWWSAKVARGEPPRRPLAPEQVSR